MKRTKTSITTIPVKLSRINEKEDLNLDNIVGIDTEEVDKKLKEIDIKIENIGNICDKKKQKSYDEISSILKKEKAKINDDLSALNQVLNDTIKQNTKDHYFNNLKKEVAVLKEQVTTQDKLLSGIIY
jgi:hypothetical protein